jgi:hypothetical protein
VVVKGHCRKLRRVAPSVAINRISMTKDRSTLKHTDIAVGILDQFRCIHPAPSVTN